MVILYHHINIYVSLSLWDLSRIESNLLVDNRWQFLIYHFLTKKNERVKVWQLGHCDPMANMPPCSSHTKLCFPASQVQIQCPVPWGPPNCMKKNSSFRMVWWIPMYGRPHVSSCKIRAGPRLSRQAGAPAVRCQCSWCSRRLPALEAATPGGHCWSLLMFFLVNHGLAEGGWWLVNGLANGWLMLRMMVG